MNYRTIPPPKILQNYVKYFWVLECKNPENAPTTFSAIVDGCPGAIIMRSREVTFFDESNKKLPGMMLYGQTVTPVKLSATGGFDAVGICFQPHALKSIFGIDADE